ncbi:MAG: tetratricopeptide repeat protein [Bacteroidota bacterium]
MIQKRNFIILLLGFLTSCFSIFSGQSQDFKIDDKVPIPIPIATEKAPKGASEASFVEGMKFYLIEEYSKALDLFEKTLKIEPNNAGLNFQISATYQKLNKIERAIEFAKKAYDLEKSHLEYSQMYAGLLAKNDQFAEAATIYKILFDADPTNSEVGLNLAASYYSQSKFEEVLKIYQIIEKNLGTSQELTNQKQRLFLKLNRVKDAIEEGDKLIKAEPSDVENYIDQAELLIRNDKEEAAQVYIAKALKINPESGQVHILLADIARRKNDFPKMYEELNLACEDKSLESGPLAKILYSFLDYLPENSDKSQQEKLINKIIEIHPQESRGYLLLGDLLFQKNNKKGANENYLKAVKLEKNNNQIWMRILAIDNDLGAFKEAISHSEEAIELYPNQAIFWYYNGAAYFMSNNFDKTVESLDEARRLAGDEKDLIVVVNTLLGESYNRLGQHTKSDEAFEAVLKLDPASDAVANNYSYFLALRKENLAYAKELAAKLVERNPNNSTFLDTYGWILFTNKEFEKAKQYLEKAYQINEGKSAVITEHYGDVLFKIGEKEKAIELWKKAAIKETKNKDLERKISEGRIIE